MSIRIQIEITPTNIIPLTVPDEQFIPEADAEAIAREIPGNNAVGSMLGPGESLVPSGPDLNPDGSSKRQWPEITWDTARWPKTHFGEPAFKVLQMKQAMIAAGKSYSWKEGADGYPEAVEIHVVLPSPPVATNPPNTFPGFPGSGPTAAKTATDVWNYLVWRFGAPPPGV